MLENIQLLNLYHLTKFLKNISPLLVRKTYMKEATSKTLPGVMSRRHAIGRLSNSLFIDSGEFGACVVLSGFMLTRMLYFILCL